MELSKTIEFTSFGHRHSFPMPRNVPALGVTIAYEDKDAGLNAMKVLSVLALEAGHQIEIEPGPWRMDLLTHPDLIQLAEEESNRSHLLILSIGSSGRISSEVVKWTNTWLRNKKENPAAIILLSSNGHPVPNYQLREYRLPGHRGHYYQMIPKSHVTPQLRLHIKKPVVQNSTRALLVTGMNEDPCLHSPTLRHYE
jgi:hypothetical protein